VLAEDQGKAMAVKIHTAGERVLISGLYRVVHYQDHAPAQDVIALSGDRFIPCKSCGNLVAYTRLRPAPHMLTASQLTCRTYSGRAEGWEQGTAAVIVSAHVDADSGRADPGFDARVFGV
jgi:hypothetical protein